MAASSQGSCSATQQNSFVAYDNASKAAVTLGGTNGTQIHNVAAEHDSYKDAVNLGQLRALRRNG